MKECLAAILEEKSGANQSTPGATVDRDTVVFSSDVNVDTGDSDADHEVAVILASWANHHEKLASISVPAPTKATPITADSQQLPEEKLLPTWPYNAVKVQQIANAIGFYDEWQCLCPARGYYAACSIHNDETCWECGAVGDNPCLGGCQLAKQCHLYKTLDYVGLIEAKLLKRPDWLVI